MSFDSERLRRLLGSDDLAGLRERLATRCLRSDGSSRRFLLSRLRSREYDALCGLLGRQAREAASSLRLSLRTLDDALLRAGLAPSLRVALEVLGGPLRDERADRHERQRSWQALRNDVVESRLRDCLRSTIAFGSFKRGVGGDLSQARRLLEQASRVVARLPARGMPLAWLAADTLGDAHALDSGRPLARLILNALAPKLDGERGESVRIRWAQLGIGVNELARPALMLNLPAHTTTTTGRLVDSARIAGEPLYLSLRLLLRSPPAWCVAGRRIHVCENPNVVALAVDRLGVRCAPLVCTDGMPAAAQRMLLRQLTTVGAQLVYHGDFDWPGIAIGNCVMSEFGARPWQFGASDYAPLACGGLPLSGSPVVATWDFSLSAAMAASGIAVHEEAAAESLLASLAE